jgi:hypothetical protein
VPGQNGLDGNFGMIGSGGQMVSDNGLVALFTIMCVCVCVCAFVCACVRVCRAHVEREVPRDGKDHRESMVLRYDVQYMHAYIFPCLIFRV